MVEAQDPCRHAALWRGSIFPPFMSPDNQQQPCCLDQWLANFHTRRKQRLNMGALQQFMESVLFFFELIPPKNQSGEPLKQELHSSI